MKKFWVLLMLITSVTAHAQKALKPVLIKVITTEQKTVTGFLYSISDSTISLSTNSKIKWEQLQSNEISNENARASADSVEAGGVFSNHILITTFSYREIEKVKTPIRNATIPGMIVGALIGVRAGMWVGAAMDANNTDSHDSSIPLTVGFLALNGAIIGGFLMPHQRTFWIDSDEQSFNAMIDHLRSKYCTN